MRMRTGPYGVEVLRTAEGSWWWEEGFFSVDWIPAGRRYPAEGLIIRSAQNTLAGATMRAAKAEAARLKERGP